LRDCPTQHCEHDATEHFVTCVPRRHDCITAR
jgi:hypothetical protein